MSYSTIHSSLLAHSFYFLFFFFGGWGVGGGVSFSHQATIWAGNLVIADGHYNLPQRVCVCMYCLTYSLYVPQGNKICNILL